MDKQELNDRLGSRTGRTGPGRDAREDHLIDHIAQLQRTLRTISGALPADFRALVEQNIRMGEEVLRRATGN